MMKVNDFIAMLKKALNSNTIYCSGGFGFPITEEIITSKSNQFNYSITKQNQLRALIGKNYFGFDCVNLIKAVLWGWDGNLNKTYGGAIYKANGVPDVNDATIIKLCTNVTTNFKDIVPGALVWLPGHVGIYIGNGQVIEATTKWTGNVLVSSLGNLGYNSLKMRVWSKWGKLPWVDYKTSNASVFPTTNASVSSPSNTTKVLAGEGYYQIMMRVYPNKNTEWANLTAQAQKLNNNKALHVGDIVVLPNAAISTAPSSTNATTTSASVTAYNTFISGLKTALGLSQSTTLSQLYAKLPKLYNNNQYSKITVVLQTHLNALGFSCGKADGYFGNNTEKAVKLYQTKYTGTADGVLSAKGKMWKHIIKL